MISPTERSQSRLLTNQFVCLSFCSWKQPQQLQSTSTGVTSPLPTSRFIFSSGIIYIRQTPPSSHLCLRRAAASSPLFSICLPISMVPHSLSILWPSKMRYSPFKHRSDALPLWETQEHTTQQTFTCLDPRGQTTAASATLHMLWARCTTESCT
jgi:hypothetical protein